MGLTHYIFLLIISYCNILITHAIDNDTLCNGTTTARVEYEFATDIINSEHIITFKGYFARTTRENYVTAALRNAGVSPTIYYFFINKSIKHLFLLGSY